VNSLTRRLVALFSVAVLPLWLTLPAAADQEYSHARIVRLSFVEGTVTVLRPGAPDWANASVNTPIEEGFQLSTDKDSFAEVQFENGSTARVGELSLLKFDQLGLAESGDSLNRLALAHGYGTFSVVPEHVGVFEVTSSNNTFKPQGKAEFRVDLDQDKIRVEVFKGSVDVNGPEVSTTLARKTALEITPGADQPYTISQNIQRDDWDDWVAQRDQQEAASTPPGGMQPQAPAYGWSDLNNFGTWSYFDGYGYGWVPDVAGPWSPFGFGQWSWYPGFGYTWISFEPWGWLPYHFGGWSFDPLFGWAWFPGATWGWSPAVVSWYQGPGWIGWGPRPPVVGTTGLGSGHLPPPRGCPGAPGCITAINTAAFEKGGPIRTRELLRVNATEGVPVVAPAARPGLLSLLPGKPTRLSSAQEALFRGNAPRTPSLFERLTGTSPSSGRVFARPAPLSAVAGPPAAVRGDERGVWGGRLGVAAPMRSGGVSTGAREQGGFGRVGASRSSEGMSGGVRGGGFSRGGGGMGGFGHGGGGPAASSSAGASHR
jgi:Family of unknown function (DUF6600)/FecR protein